MSPHSQRGSITRPPTSQAVSLALVAVFTVLALAAVPTGVAAQETRAGGSVVVEANETVDGDLETFGGDVAVRGTVDGDLSAFAGNVRITGTVTGDVEAAAGNVLIAGNVGGNVSAAGGNVQLAETGSVGGNFEAGASTVQIAGSVAENARVGATSISVEPSASIGGDLVYDGALDVAEGAQIQGETIREDDLDVGAEPGPGPLVPGWVFGVYAVLVNLVVGAILLLVFPAFSRGLVDRTVDSPGRTGFLGLGVIVGVPIALVLVALTVVGIPISIVGFVLSVILAWIASIYGRYVLGAWLLSLVDRENRWAGLALGVLLVAVLVRIPVVGGIVDFGVLVWGLGALAWGLWAAYRAGRGSGGDTGTATGADDVSAAETG